MKAIICDRCGTVIKDKAAKVRIGRYNAKSIVDLFPDVESGMDYCDKCAQEIRDFILKKEESKKAENKVNKDKLTGEIALGLRKKGKTNQSIADEYGVSKSRVAQIVCAEKKKERLKDINVTEKIRDTNYTIRKGKSEPRNKAIVHDLAGGADVDEVMHKYGLSRAAIRSLVEAYKEGVITTKRIDDEVAKLYFEKEMLHGIDYGKVKSLTTAKWTVKQIADEFSITENVARVAMAKALRICTV